MSGASVTLPRVVRAELTKLGTLPGYLTSLVSAFLLLAAFGLLAAFAAALQAGETGQDGALQPSEALAGVQAVQLLLSLTAVVFATSEWAQGTVQPTYLSVPRRLPVLAAKAGIVAGVSLAIGSLGAGIALLTPALILDRSEVGYEITAALATQLVLGTGLYLAAISVLGLALATIIRSTVGALVTVLALLTVAPLLVVAAPIEWLRETAAWLPSTAGLLVLQPEGASTVLTPWTGLAVSAGWAVAALIAAAIAVRRTDA